MDAQTDILQTLTSALNEGKKVLWLLCGGSNIALEAAVAKQLGPQKNLTVTLMDERYGEVGHTDSNWRQLQEAGFPLQQYTHYELLAHGDTGEAVAAQFEAFLREQIPLHQYVVGVFGMGADGHTAGILPNSAAAEEMSRWTIAYQAPPFERISITALVFPYIDRAFLVANGGEKVMQIARLDEMHTIEDQPAQLLKRTKSFKVYYKA